MKVAEGLFLRARDHFDYESWLGEFANSLDTSGRQLLEHMRQTLNTPHLELNGTSNQRLITPAE